MLLSTQRFSPMQGEGFWGSLVGEQRTEFAVLSGLVSPHFGP